MAIKIRLARGGSKKRPYYHIVAADERSPRDGRFIEKLGHWNPMLPKDSEERVVFDTDRVKYWLGTGAQPTDRVLRFLAEAGIRDAFGHAQLGGVAPVVAGMVRDQLGYKYHYAVADYLQRSARHIASAVDVEQAYAVGREAVRLALAGKNAVMPVIKRTSDKPYRWKIESAPLSRIANKEKKLPRKYITKDGFGITDACRKYLEPLIRGEDYPPYINGLPKYPVLRNVPVPRKLQKKFML